MNNKLGAVTFPCFTQEHVKKINEEMDKVVSGSLLPSKTTGSMLESGKCKETGTSIAIAVVGVPVPVPSAIS